MLLGGEATVSASEKPIKVNTTTPSETTAQSNRDVQQPFTRKDFFRDLKKASKKQDQPSQRGQEKR